MGGMGWGAGRPGTHDILNLHGSLWGTGCTRCSGCSERWTWLPATPKPTMCGPLWVSVTTIADTHHPHRRSRLTTKGDQNFRTENENVVGREDGKEDPGHHTLQRPLPAPAEIAQCTTCPAVAVQKPSGVCGGDLQIHLQIALDTTSFPRTEGQLSRKRSPLCSPACPFTVPPLARPQPCSQWDSHSHLVLWGHLWLGRAWC